MESRPRTPPEADIRRGHEEMDVRSSRGFVYFVIGFLVFAVITHVVLWWLYGAMARHTPKVTISPLANQSPIPPEPRLQGSAVHPTLDVQDMGELRRAEEEKLSGYGWVNREAGVVRIPISRALGMTLERGLPKGKPATQTAPAGR